MRLFLIFLFLIPGLRAEEKFEDQIKREFASDLADQEVPEKFISYFTEEDFLNREKHLAKRLEEFRKASQDGEQSHYVQILLSMNKHLRDNQAVDFHWVETDLAWIRGWESCGKLRLGDYMFYFEKGSRGLNNFREAYFRFPFILEFDSHLPQPQAQAQSDYFGDQSYARMEEIRFSGSITRRDSEGKKQSVETWFNGELDGKLTRFYKNGKRLQEIEFSEGKPHGIYTLWAESGIKLIELNYQNGLPHGKLTHWQLNGIPKAVAHYQEGLPVGTSQMWGPSGKLLEAVQWEKGKPWNATMYKSDGTPHEQIGLKRGNGFLPRHIRLAHDLYAYLDKEFYDNWDQFLLETEAEDMVHFINGYRIRQGTEISWANNMRKAISTTQIRERKFIDGKINGVKISWENKEKVQESYYLKGVRHGLTTRWDYTPNGEKLILWKANFDSGIPDGNCKWWSYQKQTRDWSKNDLYLQLILNDFSEKQTPRYSKNDSIARRATLKMGVLHGPFTQWVEENNITIQGNYANNLKHGKWIRRDKQGEIFSEIEWKEGRRWNAQVTKPNGQTCELTTLADGNGSLCSYSTDGNLISFLSFSNGLPHGLWMKANDGNLLKGYNSYTHFVDGKIEGLSLKFENQSNRIENYRNHSLDGLVYQLSRDYKNNYIEKLLNFAGNLYREDKYKTMAQSLSIYQKGKNLSASIREQNPGGNPVANIPNKKKNRENSIFYPHFYTKISDLSFSSEPKFKNQNSVDTLIENKESFQKIDTSLAQSLRAEGRQLSQEGKHKQAILKLEELLALEKKTYGENALQVAEAHLDLGTALRYREMNSSKLRTEFASSYETIQPFESALEIFYRELEANDPKVVEVHEKLSLLLHGSTFDLRSYKREGKTSGPQHARLALAKRESFLSEKFFLLTPTERMNFQRKHRPFDFLGMYSNDEELANAVLRHKGIVLDSELEDEIFRKLFAKRKPSGKTYLDLREEQLELLELFSQNIQFSNPAKKLLKILLHNLQNDYLEDKVHWLKENIGPIKRRALSVNQEQVRNALPENACLIEFFKFSDYGLENIYRIRAEPAYGAFILGKTEKPKYIYCGPADWIEENTDKFIRWSQNSKQGALPNVAVHNVYKSVMQPILAELPEGTEKIIISPDGKLNFLPFSALYRKDSIFNFHWAHYFLVLVTYLAVIFFVLVRLKHETLGKRISPLVFTLLSLEALWLIFELIKGIQNFGKSPLSDLYLIPSLTIGILYRFALSQNSYKFSQQIIAFTSLTLIFGILRTSSYFQDFDYDYLIGKEGLLHSVQAAGISLLDRAVILAVYFIPLWVALRLVAKLLGSKTILFPFILLSVCSCSFVLWIEYALIFWNPVNATALSKCALVIFLLYFGWLLVFEARKEKYGFQPILGKITPALSITLLLWFLSFKMEPSMFVWEQGQPGPLLCEKYDISYVSTGRDLLDEFQQPKKDKKALVLGNPKYLLKEKMETLNEEALAYSIENTTSNLNIIRSLNFTSLPGTQTEVEKLTQLLEKRGFAVTQLMGQEASEKNLYIRAFEQPQILHFATHGFFVGNRKKLGDDFGQVRFFGFERENNETIDNPMKRAGLALSGAKSTFEALAEGHQIIETNDGIVTAKEAAAINLDDNWLTALSACETGAGESQDGEGVLGLRRAFAQAGTQNLLLTLWPVDDNKTVDFMQAFYEEALKTGNAPGALAKVQREFLVKYRKEESLSRAIRYFAPFILTFRGALPE